MQLLVSYGTLKKTAVGCVWRAWFVGSRDEVVSGYSNGRHTVGRYIPPRRISAKWFCWDHFELRKPHSQQSAPEALWRAWWRQVKRSKLVTSNWWHQIGAKSVPSSLIAGNTIRRQTVTRRLHLTVIHHDCLPKSCLANISTSRVQRDSRALKWFSAHRRKH